ncbi:hypothetical protein F511_44546 [Dorcoceras hygrometricum]|uniref:Uncharacterized protein n=1 Tax=Dorcoceras hygrometricum TaxID=472368 RepID=A0A2Z7B702_9LAMI|nr:hypothetical protein F511_44546 [Dorcoceras hygrometricum]
MNFARDKRGAIAPHRAPPWAHIGRPATNKYAQPAEQGAAATHGGRAPSDAALLRIPSACPARSGAPSSCNATRPAAGSVDQRSLNEAAAAGRPRMKRRLASPVMLDQRRNDLRLERPAMRPPACIGRNEMRGPRDETRAHVRLVDGGGGGPVVVSRFSFSDLKF